MLILANTCLALAVLIYLYPLVPMLRDPVAPGGATASGTVFAFLVVLTPLWLLVSTALAVTVHDGAFGWVAEARGTQAFVVLLACALMAVITWLAGALRAEKTAGVPWALRPLRGWAVYVFPLTVFLFLAVELDGGEAAKAGGWHRYPFGACAVLAAAACLGLGIQAILTARRHSLGGLLPDTADRLARDRQVLAEVETLDPFRDLGRLLNETSRYESRAIREIALRKVRQHPRLQDELEAMLGNEWYVEALVFLESNDPPDASMLAHAVGDALERVAASVSHDVRTAHFLEPGAFDACARRAVEVAAKFRSYGVDYRPAIRAFRDALDEPRRQKVRFTCRRLLEEWLEKEDERRKKAG
jgi:hypothetical protein